MTPRTGRPPKENKMDRRLQIRVDDETIEKLDFCADRMNENRSEIVRDGINLIFEREKKKDKEARPSQS